MIIIKTPEDIKILREGGKLHAEILEKLARMVKPSVSARELNERADELIKENGDKSAFLDYKPYGAKRPYPASLCVSVNDEVVHGIPNEGDKILNEGDIVSLDLGIIHKGLITDAAITVPVGTVNAVVGKLLSVTQKALMEGIKAARGGSRVGDISHAIEKIGLEAQEKAAPENTEAMEEPNAHQQNS